MASATRVHSAHARQSPGGGTFGSCVGAPRKNWTNSYAQRDFASWSSSSTPQGCSLSRWRKESEDPMQRRPLGRALAWLVFTPFFFIDLQLRQPDRESSSECSCRDVSLGGKHPISRMDHPALLVSGPVVCVVYPHLQDSNGAGSAREASVCNPGSFDRVLSRVASALCLRAPGPYRMVSHSIRGAPQLR